ncbi:SusC/RagA family TonB-linked outer membrane protein [Pontibacter diazotrophicus]|uniref:SusC/RagA family TonB-linked outer membrane protein n=1 Tax=Pontibacter diazotrophicus TaxID=1400979 RepID=A0A3D8L9T9_9BACT|nr:SusC/RagA family TonB-linked outer membrane protein [Pontibacter diazotrophicus]RDV14138.1 SusC/RagA family TonB-linked outer membrane protein [Pontibacter diazotrophicus]
MKRILLLSLFLITALLQQAMAQVRAITGRVTDASTNQPLPGVAVLVKGTTNGTATGADGTYSISVPVDGNTLVYRYIGYTTIERAIGNAGNIDVSLSVDDKQLQEVVVTALGYQREKETLPYSVGAVGEENLTYAKSNDVSTALIGKVSGVQVQGSPSSTFDNANIVIRGANGLSTSQPPLYIVDGTITDQNSVIMDNVASISVLKGAAATALYGNRAGNGVVIITSKKGAKGTPTVELNLSASFERPSVMMPYQNEYAGGYTSAAAAPTARNGYSDDGFYVFRYDEETHPASWAAFDGQNILEYGADESWGPRMNGQQYRPYYSWYPGEEFGQLSSLVAQPNNIRDFYRTGTYFNNSIAVSGGADNYLYRVTYANQNRSLITPNANRDQHQVGLNSALDVTKKLTVTADFSYTYNNTKGQPGEGYALDGSNVTQNFNQWFQRQLDFERLKKYRNPDGSLNSWNIGDPNATGDPSIYLAPAYWDSPYFVINENYSTGNNNILVGNLGFNYKFNDHFGWQSYARMSYRNRRGDSRIATGGINTDEYATFQDVTNEMNYESNFTYKQVFGDFSVDALAGGNIRRNRYNGVEARTQGGLSFPNFFDISASVARPLIEREYNVGDFAPQTVRSLYGRASFGFKSLLFVDVTGRNDWSSTLPENNNSFFYPSVGGSFVFSELLQGSGITNVLSSGKLRASWAQVGDDPSPFQVNIANINEPLYNGTASASIGNVFRTGAIEPSVTTSWEVGTDLRLFNSLGLEFTYYVDNNERRILNLDIDPTTGFSSYQINAGKIQRKGFEASLSATPFRSGDFAWDVVVNFGRNRSVVEELTEGLDNYLVSTQRNDTRLEHRVGAEWGMLVGRMWRRDEEGRVVVGSNGLPLYDINQERGTIQPDYTGGLFNNLTYKGLSLSFSVDFQKGGLFHSLTKMYGLGAGLHESTVGVNDLGNDWRNFPSSGGGILIPGVYAPNTKINDVDVSGQPNTTYIPARSYFYAAQQRDNINTMVLDKSYVKLREVRLGYELPSSLFSGVGVKGANLGVIVGNAWLIYAPAQEFGIDPSELENTWYEGGQLPATRTIGANLRVRL